MPRAQAVAAASLAACVTRSPDPTLQAFAEGIEQFAACSAVFEAGRPLTPRQKQEALVAYLRALLAKTAQPAKGIGLEQKTFTGLIQAVSRRGHTREGWR